MSRTKLIAERLKPFLSILISEEQGGFFGGRQILDGMVIASEAIHSMATSKEKAMFIKLDLAKAYDRVSWKSWVVFFMLLDLIWNGWIGFLVV